MFWRFGGYASISTLDTILDKPDVTLEELLDESDLIQELKQQNSKLIEFLRDEAALKKLLNYVVADQLPEEAAGKGKEGGEGEEKDEPAKSPGAGLSFFGGKGKNRSRSKSASKQSEDGETEAEKQDAQRKKYAYVACEVLSSEVWSITEALMENREDLRNFWQYMHRPAPLDPLQAGYFTKVNEALLDKKTEEMLAFFKSLDGIVPAMLQHVDCPMVMDLLLKIVSLEKVEGGAGIVDWLQTQDLIPLLLSYLSAEQSSATQTSAGDFLKAIITISANATTQDASVIGPNELTRQLVSESCVNRLITDMLRGGNPLTVGVGIIIEVIRKNNSDYDLDNQVGPEPKTSDPIYLGTLLRAFAERVPEFMHLIRSPSSKKPELKTAFGGRVEPLGFDRFKTCELMAELLHCSNMALLNERGAEEDVRRRDAERERLKAEGKLQTPRAPGSPDAHEISTGDEFGSSVDSHGFHHAERPSDDEMERGKPKLEVQNASDEDGFEKVNADQDDLPDEVSFDDLNEKDSLPAGKQEQAQDSGTTDMPKPLSPNKRSSSPVKSSTSDKPADLKVETEATKTQDSPTSAGVTEQLHRSSIDEDTVMSEFGEEPSNSPNDDGPSELERELAKQAERPAPLFAKRETTAEGVDPVHGGPSPDASEQPQQNTEDVERSTATLQPTAEEGEIGNSEHDDGERPAYETEDDGRPVVGDLLKIRFVEEKVVSTIMDFFFRFPWNNFLHNVVYDVVQQVFNGTLDRGYNRALAFDLFRPIEDKEPVKIASEAPVEEGAQRTSGIVAPPKSALETLGFISANDITDRILDGQVASDKSQAEKGMRLGYMGHLTLIAEEVCKFGGRLQNPDQPDLKVPEDAMAVLERIQRPEWTSYVEGILAETRERDNAVLGGVRPENAIGMRAGGGFSSNAASALASAGLAPQDSLALSDGGAGQTFEINSGTMLSGFGDGDDDEDEEMAEERIGMGERRTSGGSAFSDDEQASPDAGKTGSVPEPLKIPPSRARRQLQARLDAKKEKEPDRNDPDAEDAAAVETATHLPNEPDDLDDNLGAGGPQSPEGPITGVKTVRGMKESGSKFSGLFGSDSSDDEDEDDDDDDEATPARNDHPGMDRPPGTAKGPHGQDPPGVGRRNSQKDRRPSTTEAKERQPLSDEDEDVAAAEQMEQLRINETRGSFTYPDDDSSDDDMVEIRPRRTS
ncbi:SAPS-domain-containing protein [Hortaea werneckii]|nr:SAPS-domain-containing protein [Hortaea werneckii]KAI7357952.1 SAPS-domain-containing protein [Hortaea werneckii]